jgi:hypothetical protein
MSHLDVQSRTEEGEQVKKFNQKLIDTFSLLFKPHISDTNFCQSSELTFFAHLT